MIGFILLVFNMEYKCKFNETNLRACSEQGWDCAFCDYLEEIKGGNVWMAKYKIKPTVVEAEVYKEGMEDGYACSEIFGKFIGYFDKNGSLPKTNRIPAIKTTDGWEIVPNGYYIITEANGNRYTCDPEVFKVLYEKVEDGDM